MENLSSERQFANLLDLIEQDLRDQDNRECAEKGLGPCVGDDERKSDLRLKHDVHRVGTTVFGLPLYHFKYLRKSETYEGVMAQDVLEVMPGAVSVGADGYYRVNYNTLGMSMRQVG